MAQEQYSNIDTTTVGYRDLDLRFKIHPALADIKPVTDIDAIKNSIKNILLTRRGERPFNPRFGSGVAEYLFENATPITQFSLGREIEDSIKDQEPRVELTKVKIIDDIDNNAYNIRLEMIIVTSQENVDMTLILKRLR